MACPLQQTMLIGPLFARTASLRLFASAALVCCLLSSPCSAEDKSVVAAASAFARGQQAELTGEHERAAELFELADRIAPTPEALRSATRARLAAQQLPRAAGHAEELLKRYRKDAASRELAERVLGEARPALTRLTIECSEPCTVVVDGLASSLEAALHITLFLTPDPHELSIVFEGARERKVRFHGAAGSERTVHAVPPVSRAAEAERAPAASTVVSASNASAPGRDRGELRGVPPAYFWTCAGLTLASAGLTLWSGLDLLAARDDFKSTPQPTQAEFDAGERKDMRTSVLLGATGALAVSTAVVGWFTRFQSAPTNIAAAVDASGTAHLHYHGRF